jgi:hypothetical protein
MTLLKLDIDDSDPVNAGRELRYRVEFINRLCGRQVITLSKVYQTTNGYHAYLDSIDTLNDPYTVIFQLLLGSDWKREAFNLNRIFKSQSMEEFNVLFSEKYKIVNGKKVTLSKERFGLSASAFIIAYKTKGIKKKVIQFFTERVNTFYGVFK